MSDQRYTVVDKSFYYMGSQHEAVAQAEEYAERTIRLHAGEEAKNTEHSHDHITGGILMKIITDIVLRRS